MGIDITVVIVLFVTNLIAYMLGNRMGYHASRKRVESEQLDVMQKGTRVRYRGSKDGNWKFGIIEEDIIGKRTLIILRGVQLELDEVDQLVVKVSSRIFPIKKESIEILGYDEVWLKKDLA